jgi:hypothetical protein
MSGFYTPTAAKKSKEEPGARKTSEELGYEDDCKRNVEQAERNGGNGAMDSEQLSKIGCVGHLERKLEYEAGSEVLETDFWGCNGIAGCLQV